MTLDKIVHMLLGPSGTGKTEFGSQLARQEGCMLVGGDEIGDDLVDAVFGRPSGELLFLRGMPLHKRFKVLRRLHNSGSFGDPYLEEIAKAEATLRIEDSLTKFGSVVYEPKTVTRERRRGVFAGLNGMGAAMGWVIHVFGYMTQADTLHAAYERMRARQLSRGGLHALGMLNYPLAEHLRQAAAIEPLSLDEGFERIFTVRWAAPGQYDVKETASTART
ncbi:hypothetical protein HYU16_01095 [Candidatus Woesearchaeota archaeon]|nr:hypothetical protein [Candidatus Woesearchaeota archaeon]